MLDFDFDVVTGPSKASCPAVPQDPKPEEDRRPAEPARADGERRRKPGA